MVHGLLHMARAEVLANVPAKPAENAVVAPAVAPAKARPQEHGKRLARANRLLAQRGL